MAKKTKLELPPLDLGDETPGERIAKLRKKQRLTQKKLGAKIGIPQGLVSDYERSRLRTHPEMLARFALALEVSADELLGLPDAQNQAGKLNPKSINRLKKIESLAPSYREIIYNLIDTFLKDIENLKKSKKK